MELKDLAVEHPYYCSEDNYFSNEASSNWNNMSDFLDVYENLDVDFNLVFRWDVHPPDEDHPGYRVEIFIMHQRKGIFSPHRINLVTEDDVERLVAYLEKHLARLKEMWAPFDWKPEVE